MIRRLLCCLAALGVLSSCTGGDDDGPSSDSSEAPGLDIIVPPPPPSENPGIGPEYLLPPGSELQQRADILRACALLGLEQTDEARELLESLEVPDARVDELLSALDDGEPPTEIARELPCPSDSIPPGSGAPSSLDG